MSPIETSTVPLSQGERERLERGREWAKNYRERQELNALSKAQEKVEKGEEVVFDVTGQLVSPTSSQLPAQGGIGLRAPSLPEPHRYKAHGQSDYDQWYNNVTSHHQLLPTLGVDHNMIAYTIDYVSGSLKLD